MDNIVSLQQTPSSVEAEKIIRTLAEQGAISWSKHCKERMKQRDITIPQVIHCLLKGKVFEEPFLTYENGGGYETSIEKVTAGDWLRIVVCLKFNQRLLIITAIK